MSMMALHRSLSTVLRAISMNSAELLSFPAALLLGYLSAEYFSEKYSPVLRLHARASAKFLSLNRFLVNSYRDNQVLKEGQVNRSAQRKRAFVDVRYNDV